MPSIKLAADGSVILKDGKPSCTCCGCSCGEELEDTYEVIFFDPLPAVTVTRDSPCGWSGEWNQTPYGYQPIELLCESGEWLIRLYYSGGAMSDYAKLSPTTSAPVGDYENEFSVE